MNNEISDIRRAHIDYMWADERSDAFKNAKALLERVHAKWGTTNPDEIRNLTK